MSSIYYRRAGIYRRIANGRWEDFCDIHFKYTSAFDSGPFSFGANKMTINQINNFLREKSEFEDTYNEELSYELSTGGHGWFERIQHREDNAFRCEFGGPILYGGAECDTLELVM